MDFDNQNSQPSSGNTQTNIGQSLLGGLLQTVGDDVINYGSRYLEQQVDKATQNL